MLCENMPTVIVDWKRCSGKGTCVDICSVGVFELQEIKEYPETLKAVPVKMQECILCMKCISNCIERAIIVKENKTNL